MKFAVSCAAMIAAAVAKPYNGALLLQQTQDLCRRELPSFALEWDDHGVMEWWTEVTEEYAASDAEFQALFQEWQDARNVVVTKYANTWSDLISREYDIDHRVLNNVTVYVANNCYVNGIKLGNIVPELSQYMTDNYNEDAADLVGMFGLNALSLVEGANEEVIFDFTIHEDEIEAILNIRFNQWDEATRMMETYERQFYTDLDAAWNGYVEDTLDTVKMEMDVHRAVVSDTIDYLWDRSAYPGPSLDDVYPRPSVAFAAKNAKRIAPKNDF